ncbi:MAG: hypothetical protein M3271_02535 [Actinomycetota bacterium]|nr:hypothetical protein [Actinomycetota bacterium]
MAQTNGCERFRVGTPRWTECVEDQATGGGLMPWIVVIPLAVMVVGMMIGFARQFSSAGRERARAHGVAGSAGSWLIFVAFIELAIGIGNVVAERRAPGDSVGYSIAAKVLLGVGIVLFVIGVYLKIRGRRRARIYHSGVPGEAVIRAVHETGTVVNNQPMYAFDLDVTGQGFAPVSTRHREVIPFWFLNRVGPQSRVPVKVDPQKPTRLIFDWDAFAATPAPPFAGTAPSAGGGATAGSDVGAGLVPDMGTLANAMQTAQQLGGGGSGWHAGKVIGWAIALFVLAVVGGGLYVMAQVFGEVSDVTNEVSGQVSDALDEADRATKGGGRGGRGSAAGTAIEVARTAAGREPVAFSVALPVGWNDLTASVDERQGSVVVDLVMKPQTPSEARIVVTRSLRYLEDPAPENADIVTVRRGIERELGDGLVRSRSVRLAGEAAVAFDIAPGADGLQSRQIAAMRGGQILFVSLAAPQAEWAEMLPVLDDVLASWRWGAISA